MADYGRGLVSQFESEMGQPIQSIQDRLVTLGYDVGYAEHSRCVSSVEGLGETIDVDL